MPLVEKVLLWVQASQRKRLHTGTDSKWPDTVFFSRPLKGTQVQVKAMKPTQVQSSPSPKVKAPSPHRSRSERHHAHSGPEVKGIKPTQAQK